MFNWLFKPRPPPEPPSRDRVWISDDARLAALTRACSPSGAGGHVIVLAFFEASLTRVAAHLAAAGHEPGDRLTLALAERVRGRHLPSAPVHVAERHPLPAENRALLEELAAQVPAVVPTFHTALDEPLMRVFSGDRTARLIQQLGLPPDEPVEHKFVTQALASAREKVAGRVKFVQSARSMDEWVRLNLGWPP